MTRTLAVATKRALMSVGYYAWRLQADRFPGIAVLCYHGIREDDRPSGTMAFEGLHVRASELEAHCRFLRASCQPISWAQWRAALAGGPSLPDRPVLLTFDDGYQTVQTVAQPILERHGIPALVFVCTEPVEQRQLFWHDAVARVQGEAAVERLKSAPFDEWQQVRTLCSQSAAHNDPHAPLTVAQVQALAGSTGIEIGAHTAAHPILARAPRATQAAQIVESKRRLEEWTDGPVTAFAYPNGRPSEDYTAETVDLVARNGFVSAFTTRHGFATPAEPDMERSRFFMLAGISAAELAHRLCHSWR